MREQGIYVPATRKPQQIGTIARGYFARLHHACMRAPLHTLHLFFLSFSAMLIPLLNLKRISISLDVGMFAAKSGVDQMFGRE